MLLVVFLTLIGLLLVAREIHEQSKPSSFLIVYVVSLLLFLISGLALRISAGWSERIIRFLVITSPIFCSISLVYLNKKIRKFAAFIVALLIVLATVQSYGYQPLVPSASVMDKQLPDEVPIGYARAVEVNSIYQRSMIRHAETYIPQNSNLRIACDRVTGYQILGLTSWNFSTSHLVWYYPLDPDALEREYSYFLIHLPGKSGRFYERAEIRTPDLILQVIYNSSILYSNGESYLLIEQ